VNDEVVDVLARGDLVVMPSDTVYGIFASALDESAVAKLRQVRERDAKRGFIVLIDSVKSIVKMIDLSPEIEKRLHNIWSANFATSVILNAKSLQYVWLADTRGEEATICFRVPNDPNLRKILSKTGPLCAPSANLPDQAPAKNIAEARAYFGDAVSLYVDGGEISNTSASRIIRLNDDGTVETIRPDGHNHPEDFVITRRRKLYKFARFDEFATCFHLEEWMEVRDGILSEPNLASARLSKDGERVSDKPRDDGRAERRGSKVRRSGLVLEIGAGSALFSVELARRNPNKTFIAVDIKGDRLYQGAKRAQELNLNNIFFVRSDITRITEIVPPHSVDEIWLTFPDPWPPKSDARHRLTAPRFLNYYREILRSNGTLNFKTDNAPLFKWSLEQFTEDGWKTEFLTRDLHSSDASEESKIMTSYEQRFVAEKLKIHYARFVIVD